MSSTTTHFTKIFPKRADITGSPEQAFHMLENRDKYYKCLIGGISAGTIATIGTIAPGGTFQYLHAPQVHPDLGGDPVGFVGNSSNKIGEFSWVYISLSDFKFFPFGGGHVCYERAFEAHRSDSIFVGVFDLY